MGTWKILFEVRVLGLVSKWPRRNQIVFYGIQDTLRDDGPDALGWSPLKRIGCSSWDELSEPHKATYWKVIEQQFYRVTFELCPGRTVIVRDAAYGVYRRAPLGR